ITAARVSGGLSPPADRWQDRTAKRTCSCSGIPVKPYGTTNCVPFLIWRRPNDARAVTAISKTAAHGKISGHLYFCDGHRYGGGVDFVHAAVGEPDGGQYRRRYYGSNHPLFHGFGSGL